MQLDPWAALRASMRSGVIFLLCVLSTVVTKKVMSTGVQSKEESGGEMQCALLLKQAES